MAPHHGLLSLMKRPTPHLRTLRAELHVALNDAVRLVFLAFPAAVSGHSSAKFVIFHQNREEFTTGKSLVHLAQPPKPRRVIFVIHVHQLLFVPRRLLKAEVSCM
jgi:hypothetical protein